MIIKFSFILGILIGTLTIEYGGKALIKCEKTGYETELEFKHKVRTLFQDF